MLSKLSGGLDTCALYVQSLVGQLEQLALGPGGPPAPGQPPEMATDPGQYPRPLRPGSGDAPPPFDPHSCKPAFMRMTVNAIPSSQALKARCVRPGQHPCARGCFFFHSVLLCSAGQNARQSPEARASVMPERV